MTLLPPKEELERVLEERPGDALYPQVKEHLALIYEQRGVWKDKLMSILLDDLIQDSALDVALNQVGKVIEYLAQDEEENNDGTKPHFSGDLVMKNFSRLSKLKTSLAYAELLGFEDQVLDAVLKAEVERLWQNESSSSAIIKQLLSKTAQQTPAPQQPTYPPIYTEKGKNG